MPAGDFGTLLNAVNAGQLSRQTFWTELQRRGVLSDDFDPEVEQHHIESDDARMGGGSPHNH